MTNVKTNLCAGLLFCLGAALGLGCAGGLKRSEYASATPLPRPQKEMVKFSDNPNMGTFNEKRYRRSTRKSLEDESEVHSRAGSLWNTEGQGAFLFTQNKARREGDLLNVKLEGAGKSQVETKIKVIKKLLARLETSAASPDNKTETAGRDLASVEPTANGNTNPAVANKDAAGKAGAAKPAATSPGGAVAKNPAGEGEDEGGGNVEAVPTRVVERLADGNYRVKGTQPFMIGKREYKVIVTGFVRPEDFSDEGVSSNKLLDPQWDVVSLRRLQ